MIVYGRNPVREALRGNRTVTCVWATRNVLRAGWLASAGAPVRAAAAEEIARRSGSDGHQGVCAEVSPFDYADPAVLLGGRAPLIVALDQVQDPQNLGAICRTSECAGASGLVIPERRSAAVTAAVCKAAAGATEHLPIARVRNLADFLRDAKRAGLWCYGADADGGVGYTEVDWRGGVVLVLGSEGRGLRPRVMSACDATVAIPLHGRVGSLGVGAAAAVLVFAAAAARAAATA